MQTKNKKDSNKLWAIKAFFISFILSIVISFLTSNGIENLNVVSSIIILITVIFIGILFDVIGIAVTVANVDDFNAKATKKAKGAKTALNLIKNASKVANICADVVGDICGVISGAISAMITIKISSTYNISINIQYVISALVASLTISGKALGKDIAAKKSTSIVYFVSRLLNIFDKNK